MKGAKAMREFINQTYWGNTIESYLIALGILILGVMLVKILQKIVLYPFKKMG